MGCLGLVRVSIPPRGSLVPVLTFSLECYTKPETQYAPPCMDNVNVIMYEVRTALLSVGQLSLFGNQITSSAL